MMKLYLIAALLAATLMVVHSQGTGTGLVMTENEATSFSKKSPEDEVPEGTGTGLTDDQDSQEPKEKRVLRNLLSTYSCRSLHAQGFCRYGFIKARCLRACSRGLSSVPECKGVEHSSRQSNSCCINKLSRVSCHLVRNRYRTCNANIGRYYCRQTCGHCVPSMCRRGRYRTLNDITRRQSRPRRTYKCDQNGFKKGWYRFIGYSGTLMPRKCVPINRCGTAAPGWMKGRFPGKYQVVWRTVCFHWANNCCRWNRRIRVVHCGGFILYELSKTPQCHLRYCGSS